MECKKIYEMHAILLYNQMIDQLKNITSLLGIL